MIAFKDSNRGSILIALMLSLLIWMAMLFALHSFSTFVGQQQLLFSPMSWKESDHTSETIDRSKTHLAVQHMRALELNTPTSESGDPHRADIVELAGAAKIARRNGSQGLQFVRTSGVSIHRLNDSELVDLASSFQLSLDNQQRLAHLLRNLQEANLPVYTSLLHRARQILHDTNGSWGVANENAILKAMEQLVGEQAVFRCLAHPFLMKTDWPVNSFDPPIHLSQESSPLSLSSIQMPLPHSNGNSSRLSKNTIMRRVVESFRLHSQLDVLKTAAMGGGGFRAKGLHMGPESIVDSKWQLRASELLGPELHGLQYFLNNGSQLILQFKDYGLLVESNGATVRRDLELPANMQLPGAVQIQAKVWRSPGQLVREVYCLDSDVLVICPALPQLSQRITLPSPISSFTILNGKCWLACQDNALYQLAYNPNQNDHQHVEILQRIQCTDRIFSPLTSSLDKQQIAFLNRSGDLVLVGADGIVNAQLATWEEESPVIDLEKCSQLFELQSQFWICCVELNGSSFVCLGEQKRNGIYWHKAVPLESSARLVRFDSSAIFASVEANGRARFFCRDTLALAPCGEELLAVNQPSLISGSLAVDSGFGLCVWLGRDKLKRHEFQMTQQKHLQARAHFIVRPQAPSRGSYLKIPFYDGLGAHLRINESNYSLLGAGSINSQSSCLDAPDLSDLECDGLRSSPRRRETYRVDSQLLEAGLEAQGLSNSEELNSSLAAKLQQPLHGSLCLKPARSSTDCPQANRERIVFQIEQHLKIDFQPALEAVVELSQLPARSIHSFQVTNPRRWAQLQYRLIRSPDSEAWVFQRSYSVSGENWGLRIRLHGEDLPHVMSLDANLFAELVPVEVQIADQQAAGHWQRLHFAVDQQGRLGIAERSIPWHWSTESGNGQAVRAALRKSILGDWAIEIAGDLDGPASSARAFDGLIAQFALSNFVDLDHYSRPIFSQQESSIVWALAKPFRSGHNRILAFCNHLPADHSNLLFKFEVHSASKQYFTRPEQNYAAIDLLEEPALLSLHANLNLGAFARFSPLLSDLQFRWEASDLKAWEVKQRNAKK